METKIGFGYDLHRLVEGRRLILGGIDISYSKGLLGHSDADVLLHAITDALLGAAGLGDIGELFPDTDDRYKNADSAKLLTEAFLKIRNKKFSIAHIDTVILCQEPKLTPYKKQIQSMIASILGISPDSVSVKAKTNEGLGDVGAGAAIVAYAVVLLVRDTIQ